MAQPDAYNRRKDFADQDGDDTDNSAINTELDAAGRSINQIRENLAKIQRDDGALRSGSVGKDQLAPDAFEAFSGDINAAVARAENAADESTRSAVASEGSSRDAAASSAAAATSASNARQSAANAAGAAKAMFDGIYMGSRATDPTTDGNGQPLTDGDFYFNNVAKLIRAYDAASGKFVNATPSGQFKRVEYKADEDFEPGVTDTLVLPTDPGIAANVFVSFDGVEQHHTNFALAGGSLVFGEPIPAGVQSVDVAYIEAILFPREAVIDGALNPVAVFTDVPRLKFGDEDSDDVMNRQAQALANRTEWINDGQQIKDGEVIDEVAQWPGVPVHKSNVLNEQAQALTDRTAFLHQFDTGADTSPSAIGMLIAKAINENLFIKCSESVKIRIPTDAPTLQAAIDHTMPTRPGVKITLEIQSGHMLTRGVKVENGDFGCFTITSVDPVVKLDPAFSGVSWRQEEVATTETGIIILGVRAVMPVLGCLIDAEGLHGVGYYGAIQCVGNVLPGCGIINCNNDALSFRGGMCYAGKSNFSGAAGDAYSAQQGARIYANQGNGSNSNRGAFASRGSMIVFYRGKASGCSTVAVQAQRSLIVAMEAELQNAGTHGVWAQQCGQVAANGANVSGAAQYGFYARGAGSAIDADTMNQRAIAHSCGSAACYAEDEGVINFREGVSSGSNRGLFAAFGGRISAVACQVTNSTDRNIYAFNGGAITATNATLTGAGNRCVEALAASVNIRNSDCRKVVGETSPDDIVCLGGGDIKAQNALGGTNDSPVNTIRQNGVIFR